MVLTSWLRVVVWVHPVHIINAGQRQTAVDLWTKPTTCFMWPLLPFCICVTITDCILSLLWDFLSKLPMCWPDADTGTAECKLQINLYLFSGRRPSCDVGSCQQNSEIVSIFDLLCLFFEVALRLFSSGVHSHNFYHNLCSVCAVTFSDIFISLFYFTLTVWTLK